MSGSGKRPPGYRLPAATRPGTVHLQVADLARSIGYYTGLIGLRHEPLDTDAAALFAGADATPLLVLHERTGVRAVPRGGLLGLYHFAMLLPDRTDLAQFLAHIGARGAAHGSADHAVSEALYLRDPDGLGIEVYADRPRSAWTYQAGQLHMTTAPLDVRSLMSAAGPEPWTGMPAGTSVGHLHLHVGELDRAARFYHEALGLDTVVWGYPGALFLSAGGYHHHLGLNTWSSGPAASSEDARLLQWTLVVPSAADADAAAASMHEAGFATEPLERGWVAADLWGTRLHVASER